MASLDFLRALTPSDQKNCTENQWWIQGERKSQNIVVLRIPEKFEAEIPNLFPRSFPFWNILVCSCGCPPLPQKIYLLTTPLFKSNEWGILQLADERCNARLRKFDSLKQHYFYSYGKIDVTNQILSIKKKLTTLVLCGVSLLSERCREIIKRSFTFVCLLIIKITRPLPITYV